MCEFWGGIVYMHNTVWITHGDSSDLQCVVANIEMLSHHLSRSSSDRDVHTLKARPPHFYEYKLPIVSNLTTHRAALRHNGEKLYPDETTVPKVPGEDPNSISALFCLGAVWVKDTQIEPATGRSLSTK
jgi:hypothetical protein